MVNVYADSLDHSSNIETNMRRVLEAIKDELKEDPVPPHPDQPVVWDGPVLRFKRNKLIEDIVMGCALPRMRGPMLNDLMTNNHWSVEDWTQLAQLLGYSLSGFTDLSYVSEEAKDRAWKILKEEEEKGKK